MEFPPESHGGIQNISDIGTFSISNFGIRDAQPVHAYLQRAGHYRVI